MEKQAENKSANRDEIKLTTDPKKMSNKELKMLDEFIGREDIEKCEDFHVLERSNDFSEAEVMVFFKEELFIRCRRNGETMVHNESLGMDCELNFNWDSAMSMNRNDISCVSVFRPTLCECKSCTVKREESNVAEQAKYYLVEVVTAAKDYSIRVRNKEYAFILQEYIRQWRFKEGKFSGRNKAKIKKKK